MDNLSLRHMTDNDFEAFHAMMSDYDVVKMSKSWPWPSDPSFTRDRMNTPECKAGLVKVIGYDGEFVGTISVINGEMGYMIAQAFWARGIATWAVQQMLNVAFAKPGLKVVKAGTWEDNPASMAVLHKCGFVKTGEATLYCKPRGCDVIGPDFEITRQQWEASLE